MSKQTYLPTTNYSLTKRLILTHVRGGESFSGQVCDLVPELIMTLRDKAAPIAIKGVADVEFGVAAVTLIGEVWGI